MNTIEFYELATEVAKNRGYLKPSISTSSTCYNGDIYHSCDLFDHKKDKLIRSGLHKNPIASIEAFKDAIDYNNKTYDDYIESIEE